MVLVLFAVCFLFFESQVLAINSMAYMDTQNLVSRRGYRMETHNVITGDGYILTHHRIPGNGSFLPVILHHGLCGSSSDWVLEDPSRGLGFILADEGYDVWMINTRGNRYSQKHRNLSRLSQDFWDFSWHEMGIYDLPNSIDYILEETGHKQLVHFGHSQGTTALYVLMSLRGDDYRDKIKFHVSYSPIAYHMRSTSLIYLMVKPFERIRLFRNKFYRAFNFVPRNILMTTFLATSCSNSSPFKRVCEELYYSLMGKNPKELDTKQLDTIYGHFPDSSSMKQVSHYVQSMITSKFAQYDYYSDNRQVYGRDEPPEYDLGVVDTPMYVFYGDRDAFAHVEDVNLLLDQLPNVVEKILLKDWAHYDFLYGKNAFRKVYKKTLQILKDNI